MTVTWPESLVMELAERRVVLFIGSGISKAVNPASPTWGALLDGLADQLPKKKDKALVKSLNRQGKMLDAAQVVHDGLPKADLNAELRRVFQPRPVPLVDIYNDLLQIDPKVIVTTNYDEYIEKNFEHFSKAGHAHSASDHRATKILDDLRSPMR